MWKEVVSTLILCDFACCGIELYSSDITLQWVHVIEFLQLNWQQLQACDISYTLRCIRKNLQEKEDSHEVLSPFEYRTAVIFQALIPTFNALETSSRINLWIWIGESVFQTMQCQLSHWWGDAFFFHSTHVDQTLCLHLQFLRVLQAMLTKVNQAWKW